MSLLKTEIELFPKCWGFPRGNVKEANERMAYVVNRGAKRETSTVIMSSKLSPWSTHDLGLKMGIKGTIEELRNMWSSSNLDLVTDMTGGFHERL